MNRKIVRLNKLILPVIIIILIQITLNPFTANALRQESKEYLNDDNNEIISFTVLERIPNAPVKVNSIDMEINKWKELKQELNDALSFKDTISIYDKYSIIDSSASYDSLINKNLNRHQNNIKSKQQDKVIPIQDKKVKINFFSEVRYEGFININVKFGLSAITSLINGYLFENGYIYDLSEGLYSLDFITLNFFQDGYLSSTNGRLNDFYFFYAENIFSIIVGFYGVFLVFPPTPIVSEFCMFQGITSFILAIGDNPWNSMENK